MIRGKIQDFFDERESFPASTECEAELEDIEPRIIHQNLNLAPSTMCAVLKQSGQPTIC